MVQLIIFQTHRYSNVNIDQMAMSEAEWVPRVGKTIRGTPLQGEIASLQSNINSDKPHSVTIQLTPETHQEIADGAYINYKLTDEILFAAA